MKMKTAMVNGKSVKISYKTSTSMYTRMTAPDGKKKAQYGADIYKIDNDSDNIVMVGTSHNGSTLQKTTIVITREEYDNILELHGNYNEVPFYVAIMVHVAIMERLGFQ